MAKEYNIQYFSAKVNNREIEFRCYTTDTRNGFCHTAHCLSYDITDTKASYYNRTWERFDYESVLKRAIDKLPEEVRQKTYDQIIDRKATDEEQKAEEQFSAFKALHDGLSDENKQHLANSGIEINTESDMKAVMGLMGFMSLMQ